jgi:serine/threonine-protein kinase
MNLTPGVTVQGGKYLLNHVLGQGKVERTFKATQVPLNQPVVIKTLQAKPQILIDTAQLKQEFLETVRRYARCQHPGLVRVLDCFEEGGLPFVVMDSLPGQSLTEVVQSGTPLSEQQAIQAIRQVGSALAVLHHNGLVHRDVQPANMIRLSGSEAIALVDPSFIPHPLALHQDGRDGQAFAAIEHYQSSSILTPATDIYALAASLYFLLTGQTPIAAPLRQKTSLTPLRQLQPGVSAAIEAAILSGMNLEANKRPHTIAGWFSLLPDHQLLPPVSELPSNQPPIVAAAPAIVQLPQLVTHTNSSHTPPPSPLPPSSSPMPHAPTPIPFKPHRRRTLVMVGAIAASVGLGSGLALRFGAATQPGSSLFHTEQAFPPDQEWRDAVNAPRVRPASPAPEAPVERQWTAPEPAPVEPGPEPAAAEPEPATEPIPAPTIDPNPTPQSTPSPESVAPAEIPPAEPVLAPDPVPSQPAVEPEPAVVPQPEGAVQSDAPPAAPR